MIHVTRISALVAVSLITLTGCDSKDTAKAPSVPPPVPDAATPVTTPDGTPVKVEMPPPLTPEEAAKETKAAAEAQASLQARIKAGEVGTTPDPAGDPRHGLIETAALSFHAEYQRFPATMEELARTGYLNPIPRAPAGMKYTVDPKTGKASTVSAR